MKEEIMPRFAYVVFPVAISLVFLGVAVAARIMSPFPVSLSFWESIMIGGLPWALFAGGWTLGVLLGATLDCERKETKTALLLSLAFGVLSCLVGVKLIQTIHSALKEWIQWASLGLPLGEPLWSHGLGAGLFLLVLGVFMGASIAMVLVLSISFVEARRHPVRT